MKHRKYAEILEIRLILLISAISYSSYPLIIMASIC